MNHFSQHWTRTSEADESTHSAFPDTCSTHDAEYQKKKKNWEPAFRKKVDSDARYNNVILRPFFHQNIAPFYLFLPLSHLASSMTVAVNESQFLVDAFIIVVGSFEVELQQVYPLAYYAWARHSLATM